MQLQFLEIVQFEVEQFRVGAEVETLVVRFFLHWVNLIFRLDAVSAIQAGEIGARSGGLGRVWG